MFVKLTIGDTIPQPQSYFDSDFYGYLIIIVNFAFTQS
jgi:hypothetical protein